MIFESTTQLTTTIATVMNTALFFAPCWCDEATTAFRPPVLRKGRPRAQRGEREVRRMKLWKMCAVVRYRRMERWMEGRKGKAGGG